MTSPLPAVGRSSRAIVTAMCVLVVAVPVCAQTGPYSRRQDSGQPGHSLVATGDFNIAGDSLTSTDPLIGDVTRRGRFGSAEGALAYAYTQPRVRTDWSISSVARYFSARPVALDTITYGGGSGGFDVPINGRTLWTGTAGFSHEPVSAATLFPGLFVDGTAAPNPADYDLGVPLGSRYSSRANTSLEYSLTRRSQLSLSYSWDQVRGALSAPRQDAQRVGVYFRHAINRNVGFRMGYARDLTRRGPTDLSNIDQDIIDIGLDAGYGGNIALNRRTTLSLGSGTVLYSDGRSQQFNVTGMAVLSYSVSRTWSANASYSRGLGFVQSFALPTFSDSIAADLTGQLTQRIGVQAGTGFVAGNMGLSGGSNRYKAFQSGGSVSFQMTRLLALNVTYVHYRYDFSNVSLLPTALSNEGRRHSIAVGTSVALPLLGGRRSRRL